ncbi:MAG TPA: hypothetical protein PLJ78_10105 [Anaerolineae bacterium]|nr:hypothetical protein [Anaerolineae bacterium]HQK14281.1 hypothetical protein [Anaerolineae bacterium]
MKAAIVEEARNRVVWEFKSGLLGIELALFLCGIGAATFIVLTPSPLRWPVAGILMALILIIGVFLALLIPMAERGELERTLDGGNISRTRRWFFFGKRLMWAVPLEAIAGFRLEDCVFEEVDKQTYRLARLMAVLPDADPVPLTDWFDPQFVLTLGESLAKAARLTFEAE